MVAATGWKSLPSRRSTPILSSLITVCSSRTDYGKVVPREIRAKLTIEHPKYLVLPKFGMSAAPASLAAASLPVLMRLQEQRDFDLIDAHYFFPDGVAAIRLGRRLKKPVVITARGTDVNLIPELPGPRRMIQEAAREAAGIIAVSQ